MHHFVPYLLQLDVMLTICLLSINHSTGNVTLIAVEKNLKEQLCFRETLKNILLPSKSTDQTPRVMRQTKRDVTGKLLFVSCKTRDKCSLCVYVCVRKELLDNRQDFQVVTLRFHL